MYNYMERKVWLYLACVLFTFLLCLCISAAEGNRSARKITFVAPLYITNAEFKSILVIRNSADSPVTLRLSFDSLEGAEVSHRLLLLSPHSSVSIDVDSVEMAGHRFAGLGSISLAATSETFDGIAARLSIESRNRDDRLRIEENLQPVDDKPHPLQIAFVSAPSSVPVLAIHSLNIVPQSIVVDCSDGEGQRYQSQMTLPPGMTFLVNACISRKSESRSYEDVLRGDGGGTKVAMNIRVKADERTGGIAVWGFVSTGKIPGSTLKIEGIEFVERTPVSAALK